MTTANRKGKLLLLTLLFALCGLAVSAQVPKNIPPIEPGVSHDLAAWRAAHYSDIRYKLDLTLEKMSPVLKGTMEIRVNVSADISTGGVRSEPPASAGGQSADRHIPPIILDWRKLAGHEKDSTISNVSLNDKSISISTNWPPADAGGSDYFEHLIFRDGVVAGENVIKLDFTSPILTSGSAVTRQIDKDGSENITALFSPGNASTVFPVLDQPDLKARFELNYMNVDYSNKHSGVKVFSNTACHPVWMDNFSDPKTEDPLFYSCAETKPISIYDFRFKAGPR